MLGAAVAPAAPLLRTIALWCRASIKLKGTDSFSEVRPEPPSVKPAKEPYHEDNWNRDTDQPQQETAAHFPSPYNLEPIVNGAPTF